MVLSTHLGLVPMFSVYSWTPSSLWPEISVPSGSITISHASRTHSTTSQVNPDTATVSSTSLPPGISDSANQQRQEYMQSLWPYHTYKPVTWDKYYVQDIVDKQPSISSGVAAGVTIGIFFMVFIFTFGCRIYSQYVDRSRGNTGDSTGPRTSESVLSESLAADLWVCGVPTEPPPPYEIAITMPTHNPNVAVTV